MAGSTKLMTASGGGVILTPATNIAADVTVSVPSTTDTLVNLTSAQTLTNKTLGSGLVAGASLITSGTAQASTSGTSIDFTSIPSWVKRITVMFVGVSTNGTASVSVQLGTASGVEASNYLGAVNDGDTAAANQQFSSGFTDNTTSAAIVRHGLYEFCLVGSNTWVCNFQVGFSNAAGVRQGAGSKVLAATLDRVRITTGNGTDTFDAGSINIMYE